VSNLAEEARDPVRSIPKAIRWVAIAVFAIYFTLPLVALSALPVYKNASGDYVTKLGLPPDQGGFENDPVLGLVKNLGLHGAFLSAAEVYVASSPPRSSSSRRTPSIVADHVLDVDLPAARGVPPPASEAKTPWLSLIVFGGALPILVLSTESASLAGCTRSARSSRSRTPP
jgi:APA family basic amino acid/polyamine antiporter